MAYNSKYTGQQVEELLDKLGGEGNGDGWELFTDYTSTEPLHNFLFNVPGYQEVVLYMQSNNIDQAMDGYPYYTININGKAIQGFNHKMPDINKKVTLVFKMTLLGGNAYCTWQDGGNQSGAYNFVGGDNNTNNVTSYLNNYGDAINVVNLLAAGAATSMFDEGVKVTIWGRKSGTLISAGNAGGGSITIDTALSPTSGNAVANSAIKAALDGKQDTISDLATIRSGAALGASALQQQDIAGKANTADLAKVATSGSYDDLTGKPTIPTLPTLAKVATSGSYNDLSNKPTIPAAVTVDSQLNANSANPVQNKAVKAAIDLKLDKTAVTKAKAGSGISIGTDGTISCTFNPTKYYTGSTEPAAGQGSDGDLYLMI